MKHIANFIVKFRYIILLLFVGLCIYSAWGMSQVKIEYSIASYLPQDTDTKQALDIMDEEFTTYGTARLMIRNISFEDADRIYEEIKELDGVKSFSFENTEDYYSRSCALFDITFEGDDSDPVSVAAYNKTLELLEGRDILISTSLIDTYADDLQSDINFVLLLAVGIIIVVLLFTSKSVGELPALLLTFGVAARFPSAQSVL